MKETIEPQQISPCAMCDEQGHIAQNCPEIPMIRTHLDAIDTTEIIPVVVLPSGPIVKNKPLGTNHACALRRLYGHYSHHCQDLVEFQATISQLRKHSLESEFTAIKEIHPLVSSSTTTTIYMISSSSSPSISLPMEDPIDLS